MRFNSYKTLFAVTLCGLTSLPALAIDTVRTGTGANVAGLQAIVDTFRADLGAPLNTGPGPFVGGRREINWDGVPAGASDPFPGDFFNQAAPAGRARGASFSTPGTGLAVSGAAGSASEEFINIEASYGAEFQVFSPDKLFTPLGSNITDVTFSAPGFPADSATVSGFGAIFTDVDLTDTTSLEFFDAGNNSLGVFFAPTLDKGFSFVGVNFDTERVGRVRITTGNAALGAGVIDDAGTDVVVMDDFLYAEPVSSSAAPEPASLALVLVIGGVAAVRRRKA